MTPRYPMKRIDYALDMALDGSGADRRGLGQLGGRVPLCAGAERGLRTRQHHAGRDEAAASERVGDRRSRAAMWCWRAPRIWNRRKHGSRLRRQKALPADFPWRANLARGKPAKGLIQTNHGVMMLAAAPVLDGSGGGQPLGMVFMGQLLDARRRCAMLGAHAQADLSLPAAAESRGERLTETDAVTQVDRSFEDIYGRPVMTPASRGAAANHGARTDRSDLRLRVPHRRGHRRARLAADRAQPRGARAAGSRHPPRRGDRPGHRPHGAART